MTCSHVKCGGTVPSSLCVHPLSLEADFTLSPKWFSCHCRDHVLLSPLPCTPVGRMPSGHKKHLTDDNFHGGCGHILVTHTSVRSGACCLAWRGYSMLWRVILGPIKIFYVPTSCGMYHVLRGVTASACDYRYGLILSLIVFLGLKNRLCTYCSMGKI